MPAGGCRPRPARASTIFFQGHDHLFARQELDGVIYQTCPKPADNTYTAFNRDAYRTGDILPNSGYVKVTVSPSSVKVEYIRQFLPKDESETQRSGQVAFSYTISGGTPPPPAATWILLSSARAAGQGGAFYTTDLTIANTGAAVASLGLKFLDHDVDGRTGAQQSFSLAAGRCVTYADVLGSIFGVSSALPAFAVERALAPLPRPGLRRRRLRHLLRPPTPQARRL